MKIKLTHTGTIPLDDYLVGQSFLVITEHGFPLQLCQKSSDGFWPKLFCKKSFNKDFDFVAWEPVEADDGQSSATKLWLIQPAFSDSHEWKFRRTDDPSIEISCRISDEEFFKRFDPHKNKYCTGCRAGDLYTVILSEQPDVNGIYEISSVLNVANDIESFRRATTGRTSNEKA